MTGRAHARWTQASWSESWSWDSVQFCGWSGEVSDAQLQFQAGVSENDDNLWQLQSRVNGSNVGGAPSFINPCQTPEQSESVTTFCSDWFLHRSAPSPCTWRGTFIQTSITKKSVFTGLRLFHQTCCIRTQFASVFSVSIDCIQSLWKSWRSKFI